MAQVSPLLSVCGFFSAVLLSSSSDSANSSFSSIITDISHVMFSIAVAVISCIVSSDSAVTGGCD